MKGMLYYRRNVIVLSFTVFLAALSWYQVMPFLPFFLRQMGVSKGMLPYWIMAAFAVQFGAAVFAQPFWGKMGDTLGRKPMIIRAGFCLAAVYFGMSFCQTPLQLVFLRFLNGALTGFIPGSYALIATNTPQEHAPRSLATAQSASNAGLIAGPPLGGWLAGMLGYRGSMQAAGAAVLISTLLVWWLVREPNRTTDQEKTSLLADMKMALRSPIQLPILFTVVMVSLFAGAINPYLPPHLKHMLGNGPDWQVGAVISFPAVAFLLTAQMWTGLGRKWGYRRNIVLGMLGGGTVALLLAFADSIWAFGALYLLTGSWLAAISPSTAAVTCTMVEETFRGRAYAIQQSAGMLGNLVSLLIAAPIVANVGMTGVFILAGTAFLLGSMAFRRLARPWPKAEIEGRTPHGPPLSS